MSRIGRSPSAEAGDHGRRIVREAARSDSGSATTIQNTSTQSTVGESVASSREEEVPGEPPRDQGWEKLADTVSGPVTVRALTPDDWEHSRDISLQRLTDSPSSFRTTVDEAKARTERVWRELVASHKADLVVLKEGRPIAEVKIDEVPGEANAVELSAMFVVPEHRGTGVGDLLVTECLEWAGRHGYQRVQRFQREDNFYARRLYARHDFVDVGYEPGYYPDGIGRVRMAREVD
ncbi:GNAT family N-acetyltransferase [Nocardia brasiliensis]|uniref:GNAT family N-acetyltransferase n=1 Tax=Nocardia brasiliensis TaxID=37326 RepID=UPI00245548E4|nr:GNAT family N-acetyltransferase [Nocardia brasiliensis]